MVRTLQDDSNVACKCESIGLKLKDKVLRIWNCKGSQNNDTGTMDQQVDLKWPSRTEEAPSHLKVSEKIAKRGYRPLRDFPGMIGDSNDKHPMPDL